jgi:hypothetical protein
MDIPATGIMVMNSMLSVLQEPKPWTRSGMVTVQQQTNIEALKDLRAGEIIPVHNKGNILRFIAKDIPSTGYTTFLPCTKICHL